MSTKTATAVEVTEKVMHEGEWVCPTCRGKNRKSVNHFNGQETLKCHECGQKIMKDPSTGAWATSNCIERSSRGDYSENPEGEIGLVLDVREFRITESFSFSCPHCCAVNKAEFHRPDFSYYFIPAGTLQGEDRNLIYVDILKCPHCQEMLGKDDGTWTVFREGNPQMASTPIVRQKIEIRPELRQYLSWQCPCGEMNSIEFTGEKEPLSTLYCHSCKNTATKIKGIFVMVHPRQR